MKNVDASSSKTEKTPPKDSVPVDAIGGEKLASHRVASTIPRRDDRLAPPLSFAQEGLWLLDQLEPGSPAYNCPHALRLTGPIDEAALRQALQTIIDRHEILRTRFTADDGRPAQVISPNLALDLRIIDLSNLDPTEREPRARTLATEEALRPFDLARDSILRITLLRLGERQHILVLVFHHIGFDAWSARIFLQEFASLYAALSTGEAPALAELPLQYADFAHWQRHRVSGPLLERQMDYWKTQLSGCIPPELPTERSRPLVPTHRGGCIEAVLPEPLGDSLRALCRHENATLFMALLAAFQLLLSRYTGSEDIVVASMAAGRNWVETEKLIGLFLNPFLLRTKFSGNPTFRELLGRARETSLGAFRHQDLPMEKLRDILTPGRDLSIAPFFRVAFNLENLPELEVAIPGLRTEEFQIEVPATPYDLTLEILPKGRELRTVFIYNTDIFDRDTIERMAGHFRTLIEGLVAEPDGRVGSLPLLTPAERHQILVEWNRTNVEYPRDSTLQELFEVQAQRRPNAVALSLGEQHLTYGALNREANRLAHRLHGCGVGVGTRVGFCADHSLEMMVGLLAILKAGGAVVPLDPTYPKERLAFMLEDSGIELLLTTEELKRALPRREVRVVCQGTREDSGPASDDHNIRSGVNSDDVAYVFYTSGSTGTPKGVEVLHRGIVRLVCGQDFIRFGPEEVFLAFSSISFDASTFEIWGALLHGGRCALIGERTPDLKQLLHVIKNEMVTTVWFTPSLFSTVLDAAPQALFSVSQLIMGGEALSVPDVCRALSLLPKTDFVNGYGPTESTTFACCYRIPRSQSPMSRSIPIGRPIANTQVYILDRYLQPVPVGVAGELCIGGDGLARGYRNQPEITAQKFIPNPLSTQPGSRLYKSGDLCRYLPDGNIEFLGRLDNQVKIRGFRIEIGEIESALAKHPAVSTAAVMMREEVPGEKRLVAYVVPRCPERPPALKMVRDYLQEKLPPYMVPGDFVIMEALPLTPSGKLDRRALPAKTPSRQAEDRYVAPRNYVESQLAAIWEEVLNVRPVGIEDDFFDLGGHSLLAMRMMTRIESALGRSLPLATLLKKAKIRHLAESLCTQSDSGVNSAIVPVQAGGRLPPFFFLHGDGYGGLYCRRLARLIGQEQPFYGVMPGGLDGTPLPPTVEAMAEENIRPLVALQPRGPYLLGGFCNGGLVAYEMARQMEQQGLDVGVLILLDAEVPPYIAWLKALIHAVAWFAKLDKTTEDVAYGPLKNYVLRAKFARHQGLGALAALPLQTARRKVSRLLGTPPEELGIPVPVPDDPLDSPHYRQFVAVVKSYRPKPLRGRIVLLRTKSLLYRYPTDPTAGWGKLATKVDVHELPGDHITCLTEYIGVVAERIRNCLRAFQEEGPPM